MSDLAPRELVAARFPSVTLDDSALPVSWERCVHRDDWALAAAAGAGDHDAIRAFELGPLAAARAHLIGRRFATWLVDESLQQTRVALLLAGDGPPGIWRYAGIGPLASFVRVVAVRFALKIQPDRDDELLENLEDRSPTPELATLKAGYGPLVRDALLAAWRALPAHDRFVLSLELHGRMSLEAIAALYQIHKVSAARKVARSRGVLLDAVRARLVTRLASSPETVDSVLRLITFPVAPSDLTPATGL